MELLVILSWPSCSTEKLTLESTRNVRDRQSAMVHMNLAGRVNSEEYAICERLLGACCRIVPRERL